MGPAGRDGEDRARMARPRRQTLAAVPHRRRVSGAARDTRRAAPRRTSAKSPSPSSAFHKASLIHDDIEDNDARALRREDAARGARRRRRAECRRPAHRRRLPPARGIRRASAEQKAAMLRVAADGQRELCRGQGAELVWARQPGAAHLASRCSKFSARRPRPPSRSRSSSARSTPAQARRGPRKRSTPTAKPSASPTRSATTSTISAPSRRDQRHRRPSARACSSPSPTSAPREATGEQGALWSAHWRRLAARRSSPAQIEALCHELGADERCRDAARKLQGGGHPLPPGRGQRRISKACSAA